MRCIDIIKKKIFIFNSKYDEILDLYYIKSYSIQEIIKKGYSGWDIEQCIDLNNQLVCLLQCVFNGDFDIVSDQENRIMFINRIFNLFGYVEKLKHFKKNIKVLTVYLKFINNGLTTNDFLMYAGFIFFNKSIPVTLTDDEIFNYEKEYTKLLNLYKKQICVFKNCGLFNNVTCIENKNYFTITNYNVFKNSVIPFLIYLFKDNFIKKEYNNCLKYFFCGIKLKIISCSFKFKIFYTDGYLNHCLKNIINVVNIQEYSLIFNFIKNDILTTKILFNINCDKLNLKKFNFSLNKMKIL